MEFILIGLFLGFICGPVITALLDNWRMKRFAIELRKLSKQKTQSANPPIEIP
jgi:hypothetical protein